MIDPNDKRTVDFIGRDDSVALRLVKNPPLVVPSPVVVAEEDSDGPLDAAARQRRARAKRKKLADEQGLKSVWLLQADRDVLAQALGLFDRINDGKTTPEYRLELLQKLKPGAQAEPVEVDDNSYRGFWDSNVRRMSPEGAELFTLELTAEELDEVSAAICCHWRAWEKYRNGWRARAAQSLWRRWVMLRWGYSYDQNDPQWGAQAVAAETTQVRKELMHAAWADPESAPFMLTRRDRVYLTKALDFYEYSTCTESAGDTYQRKNMRELYVRLGEDAQYGDKSDFPPKEKREAYSHEQTRDAIYASKNREIADLTKKLAAANKENELLESERNKAFSAYQVLEDRLRAAGLSTDYR